MDNAVKYHAIKIDTQKCFGCTHCMKACPTEAIRIKNGKATIINKRCVDCGNCMRICPVDAFYIEEDELNIIEPYKYKVVLIPSVFVGQFSDQYSVPQIYHALLSIGFTHVYEVEQPIQILIDKLKEQSEANTIRPLISTFCPAVVRLIESKYPSLVDNLIRVKTPHDLSAFYAIDKLTKEGAKEEEIGIFYVTPCTAKVSAVNQPIGEEKSIVNGVINMQYLFNKVMSIIKKDKIDNRELRTAISKEGILWSLPRTESLLFKDKSMAVDGIHNATKFLERLENDELPELEFLELKACDAGCAGGVLVVGNRFLNVERLQNRAEKYPLAKDIKIEGIDKEKISEKLFSEEFKIRNAFILDNNRKKALEKLEKIDKILCKLPGIDCGGCGAPNCHALAEDIVFEKAKITNCVFLQSSFLSEKKVNPKRIKKNLDTTWGEKRFEIDCSRKGKRNEGF